MVVVFKSKCTVWSIMPLPLLALKTSSDTSVKYSELRDLVKLLSTKEQEFVDAADEHERLAEEMQRHAEKLAALVENGNAMALLEDNDMELLRTWKVDTSVARDTKALVSNVFLKFNNVVKLIPLELDLETGLAGINLKNDPFFQRLNVGMEDTCYYSEANHVGLEDCLSSELFAEELDPGLHVVYKNPSDLTVTRLFEIPFLQLWDGDEPSYFEERVIEGQPRAVITSVDDDDDDDEDDDEDGRSRNDFVNGQSKTNDFPGFLLVPKMNPVTREMSFVHWEGWAQSDSYKTYSAKEETYMAAVLWATRGENEVRESVHDGDCPVQTWNDIGLGHYCIPVAVLSSLVHNLQTEMAKLEPVQSSKRTRL